LRAATSPIVLVVDYWGLRLRKLKIEPFHLSICETEGLSRFETLHEVNCLKFETILQQIKNELSQSITKLLIF
jgi:hypothetical protein